MKNPKNFMIKKRPLSTTNSAIEEEKEKYIKGPVAQHTAHPLRMQLFLPKSFSDLEDYPRPKEVLVRESDKGSIEFLSGSLNATHCDIIEILLTDYEKYRTHGSHNKENQLCRTCQFTAHQLAKDLGVGNVSRDWIIKRLDEISIARFRIIPNNSSTELKRLSITIIDSVYDNYDEKKKDNYTITVRFSPTFLALREYDTSIHLEKAHAMIMTFREPWIRMLIRYILSQEVCNEKMSSVFYHIGIATSTSCRRLQRPFIKIISPGLYSRYKKDILAVQMVERLSRLGIKLKFSDELKEWVFFYKKTELKLVHTENPKSLLESKPKGAVGNLRISRPKLNGGLPGFEDMAYFGPDYTN